MKEIYLPIAEDILQYCFIPATLTVTRRVHLATSWSKVDQCLDFILKFLLLWSSRLYVSLLISLFIYLPIHLLVFSIELFPFLCEKYTALDFLLFLISAWPWSTPSPSYRRLGKDATLKSAAVATVTSYLPTYALLGLLVGHGYLLSCNIPYFSYSCNVLCHVNI